MKRPPLRQSRTKRLLRFLKIAGDAGTVAMSLRDQPKPLDWVAVGLRTIGLGITLRDERRRAMARDPFEYFTGLCDEAWTEVPDEFRRLLLEQVDDVVLDEGYWDGDDKSPYLCRGMIGGETIAWVGHGDLVAAGPYLLSHREAETYRALGDRLWARLGGKNVLYGSSGMVLDPFIGNGTIATAQMKQLERRMRAFLDAEIPRAYLFAGPPGTGKSVAIRWLVEQLELTSVRIDLAVLARLHGAYNSTSITTSLETLLRLLRPRAMILDDLDRVTIGAPLLAFLELAQRMCVVVIASANCVSKMMGAALRPGRFDDIVTIDRLDPNVLHDLLADDRDLFERLAEVPAAYVVEFVKRRRVLGREQALAELDELIARSQKIGTADDSDHWE